MFYSCFVKPYISAVWSDGVFKFSIVLFKKHIHSALSAWWCTVACISATLVISPLAPPATLMFIHRRQKVWAQHVTCVRSCDHHFKLSEWKRRRSYVKARWHVISKNLCCCYLIGKHITYMCIACVFICYRHKTAVFTNQTLPSLTAKCLILFCV